MAFFWKGREAKLIYWIICCKCEGTEPIIKINCIHMVTLSAWGTGEGKDLQQLSVVVQRRTWHRATTTATNGPDTEQQQQWVIFALRQTSTCMSITWWLLVGLRKSPGEGFLLRSKMLLSAVCSEHPKALPEEEGGVQSWGAKQMLDQGYFEFYK